MKYNIKLFILFLSGNFPLKTFLACKPLIFFLKYIRMHGEDTCCICRLFSCGTSKEGESHLVEWNESEGAIKRTYSGFRKRSLDVVQFDTTRNRFLAAGDEFQIKFWDMDSTNLLTAVDADGGLPVSSALLYIISIPLKSAEVRLVCPFYFCRLVLD